MSDPIELRVGQVWADNDPKLIGYRNPKRERRVRIVELLDHAALVETIQHTNPAAVGHTVKVSKKRFVPSRTGFRLINEAI